MTKTAKRTFLQFGEKTVESYRALAKEIGNPANRELFMLALAWGYSLGTPAEDFKKSGTGVRLEYLKDEDNALMAAIQLAETGDPESLMDIEARHEIAEKYAEGGILLLARMMDEPGDFAKRFSARIKEEADQVASHDEEPRD